MTKKKPEDEGPMQEQEYICQFCGEHSPVRDWRDSGDICPKCGKRYDPQLERETESDP